MGLRFKNELYKKKKKYLQSDTPGGPPPVRKNVVGLIEAEMILNNLTR